MRNRLPAERKSLTHRFNVGEQKGWITIGFYPDGEPGELFIWLSQIGTLERGLCGAVGKLTSLCLQHGVPMAEIASTFKGTRFEPSGWTKEKYHATSVLDYIGRYIEERIIKKEQQS